MYWEQFVKETEDTIGELNFDQLLALRCVFEAYFNEEDKRLNNALKIEK